MKRLTTIALLMHNHCEHMMKMKKTLMYVRFTYTAACDDFCAVCVI